MAKAMEKPGDRLPLRPSLFDDFEHFFENFRHPFDRPASTGEGNLIPAFDVTEKDDKYVISAELPGVKKEDINVTLNDGVLTINAETAKDDETRDENDRVIRRERSRGKFVRSLSLRGRVKEDAVDASYQDGVLTLALPKIEAATPKKITVNG